MTLNQRIKERRELLGMTQDELSKLIGYKSISTIAKIEAGENNIPLNKIKLFANALNTSVDYLLNGNKELSVLDHFKVIKEYTNNFPYEYLFFSKDYKRELYNIIKKAQDIGKNITEKSSNEEFWTAINDLDINVDEERLIDVRPLLNIFDKNIDKDFKMKFLDLLDGISNINNIKDIKELNALVKVKIGILENEIHSKEQEKLNKDNKEIINSNNILKPNIQSKSMVAYDEEKIELTEEEKYKKEQDLLLLESEEEY